LKIRGWAMIKDLKPPPPAKGETGKAYKRLFKPLPPDKGAGMGGGIK